MTSDSDAARGTLHLRCAMALQPSLAISAAEHDYIVKGVALDVRNDGRGRLTTRPFSVDTRATLVRQEARSLAPPPTLTSALSYSLVLYSCVLYFCGNQLANTNGAARVSLGIDLRTDVICGVKLEVRSWRQNSGHQIMMH